MDEEISPKVWHGALGDPEWKLPKCVAESSQKSRLDQNSSTTASEYVDHPEVLDAKIKLLAELLKKSKLCLVYTGAGISRQSGIPDYASKAKNSIMSAIKKLGDSHDAEPTYSHYALTLLEKAGLVHYYVQQNHDGLPQKAGFPQEKVNEIHGGWFDPSNPVVQFYGSLRSDLFEDMVKAEKKTDLCLCMGTSLSGMNADRCLHTPCKKFFKGVKECMGGVIMNLQFTGADEMGDGYVSLRIWAKIDDAMALLLKHLEIEFVETKIEVYSDVLLVPYDKTGSLDKTKKMVLDLREGAKVNICHPKASHYGVVKGKDSHGHYLIDFKKPGKLTKKLRLGNWWPSVLKAGRIDQMPVKNVDPKFES